MLGSLDFDYRRLRGDLDLRLHSGRLQLYVVHSSRPNGNLGLRDDRSLEARGFYANLVDARLKSRDHVGTVAPGLAGSSGSSFRALRGHGRSDHYRLILVGDCSLNRCG